MAVERTQVVLELKDDGSAVVKKFAAGDPKDHEVRKSLGLTLKNESRVARRMAFMLVFTLSTLAAAYSVAAFTTALLSTMAREPFVQFLMLPFIASMAVVFGTWRYVFGRVLGSEAAKPAGWIGRAR